MTFTIKTQKTRKDLAQLIAQVIAQEIRYSGVPKCEYTVGNFTVKKDGSLECTDSTDSEVVNKVLQALNPSNGFEVIKDNEATAEEKPVSADIMRKKSEFTEVSLKNLYDLISAKKSLLQKALGKECIDLKVEDTYIYFPWTDKEPSFDEYTAVLQLVDALCTLAKKSQRISAKEKESENEKYAFRCFLLRLGFIGDKYKVSRKILLKNLEGSSAFKSPKIGKETVTVESDKGSDEEIIVLDNDNS